MDDVVCAALMRRARYKPALDAGGEPIPSIVRDHVVWNPGGTGENQADPAASDIVVQLDKSVLKKVASVQVIEIIGPSGRVESCAPEKDQWKAELVEDACAVARRPDIALLVRDEAGNPVRGVRAFNVSFVVGSQPGIVVR
jgi:hypothetical protein